MRSSLGMPRQCFLDPLVKDLFFLCWHQGPQDGDLPLASSVFPGRLLMTLTGTRSGAWLGGGASYSCGVLRWVHLLPVRSHLVRLLPFGGGCRLLWHFGPHLADARSGGCPRLTPWPATSTDTSRCQQVLRSGSR